MWSKLKSCFLYERTRWFLWTPVFLGIGIGIYFALPAEPPLITAILPVVSLVGLWLVRRFPFPRGMMLLLLLISVGFANIQLKSFYLSRDAETVPDRKLYLWGRIDKLDTNYRGRTRILLAEMYDFEDKPLPGRYRLSMIHKDPGLKVGDCVEMVAVVSPLFAPSLPDGYQFDRRLFFDGVTGTGYIPSEVLPVECPHPAPRLADCAAALRQSIVRRIYEVLPPDKAAVTVAIVAGDQTKISRTLIDAYRNSGLAHFLSISGLHMSMLAGLMFFLVRIVMAMIPRLALRYNSKKVAAVLAIFIGAVYLVISGAAIPAQRAFIMTLVVLLAVLFERQAISMRTLTWSALIVLAVSPEAVIGASFQMSFAAVVALVAFYEKYAGRLNRFLSGEEISLPMKIGRGLFAYFAGVIIADLVASVATLPLGIYHFNQLDYYTSLTNLISGPLIGFVIMPFVLISLLAMPFGLEWLPLKIVGFGLGLVNRLTVWVSSLPYAVGNVVSIPVWGMLLITFGGLWLCLWRGRWRIWGVAAIIGGMLSLMTVEKPDLIVDREIKTVAILNRESGKYHFLPRASRWDKRNWLTKYAAEEEKDKKRKISNPLYPERIKVVPKQELLIDGKPFDMQRAGGASFYDRDGQLKIRTVREDIGCRPWNCTVDR